MVTGMASTQEERANEAVTAHRSIAVVVGGSGAIAKALVHKWSQDPDLTVVSLSRTSSGFSKVQSVITDYSDESLASAARHVAAIGLPLSRLVICNGMLSSDAIRPERKVSDLDVAAFDTVMSVNTLLPMRVLGAFWRVIRDAEEPRIAVLSARVGSLEDNKLGGWYSYRASKAALNMMLKCAAIEAKRVNSRAKIIAYHPGTVDSALSRPFQRSVPDGKLFSPDYTATQLIDILDSVVADGDLSYLDWAGQPIPW
jgi:NAD(P)-dependent dehydrogenase (short-subunit alcohol dehydrogenase family)